MPSSPSSSDRPMSRREFLGASAAALITALHPHASSAQTRVATVTSPTDEPLILGLRLLTATPLAEMKRFYRDLLGFEVLAEGDGELTVGAGRTPITFVKAVPEQGEPWYHVAFNIPQHKLLAARRWQLERTKLIPTPQRQQDPAFPPDVRHFPHWNAHSLFFWDPAGNLLEHIARHDLPSTTSGGFTREDILYVSEIGFVVDDQQTAARRIHEAFGVEAYPRGTERWWAMGSEQGLLLCLPKRRWGSATDRQRRFAVYPTEARIRGTAKTFDLAPYPYSIRRG